MMGRLIMMGSYVQSSSMISDLQLSMLVGSWLTVTGRFYCHDQSLPMIEQLLVASQQEWTIITITAIWFSLDIILSIISS